MNTPSQQTKTLVGIIVVLLLGSGYLLYEFFSLRDANDSLTQQVQELEAELQDKEDIIDQFNEVNTQLNEALAAERQRLSDLRTSVEELAESVGVIERLEQLDQELLQKYSRIYFLNEHYIPSSLSKIEEQYTYEGREEFIHSEVEDFLEDMIDAADRDGITLTVLSAFRSFDEQRDVKAGYSVTYGSGSNQFSAEQGYSEHQLGTTVDFTVPELGGMLDGFENTPGYEWLTDNAHRYGFVLSYPPNNQFYIFEPWHWRFVGTELAKDLRDDDAHFYDWDQRDIDEYLITIFD